MSLHFSNDSSGLILCGQRVNDAQYIPGRSLLRLPLFPGLRFTVPLRTFHWSWFRLRRRIQRVHHTVVVVINDVVQIFLERSIVDMLVMVSRYRAQLLWPEVIAVVKLRVIAIIVGKDPPTAPRRRNGNEVSAETD